MTDKRPWHYASPTNTAKPICGLGGGRIVLTQNPTAVTCANCRDRYRTINPNFGKF